MPEIENSGPGAKRGRGNPAWKRGQSGNPAGKPKGTRNAATVMMEKMIDGEAEALTRKAIEMAKAGDAQALRMCLDRIAPPRKDRHVTFELPPIVRAGDAVAASSAVMAAVASGMLTPSEAGELGKLIESHCRTIETADLEERLMKLEQRTSQ